MSGQQLSMRDSLYLSDDNNETTFKYDNQLPSLPVPSVRQSVFKLLDTIRPITEGDEHAYKVVEQKALALLNDPDVNEVQELLKKRAAERKNWLEEWWLEFAYLRSRKPLIPYSNMAAPLPIMQYWPIISPGQPGFDNVRVQRSALSTYFQLCFWKMLRHERMRPMIHKGVPWSMNQFRYLFNTVRRPGEPMDELQSWFRTAKEGPPESVEIIVLYRGYIHSIKPVTILDNNTSETCILSAPQIERQLRRIESWCREQATSGPGIGSLTTNERSVWKEARDELMGISEHNKRLLDRIERALSVLVLDDHTPAGTQEIFELSMAGDANDRWADKSITSIAFKNGTFGANADHTPYDGFCTGIMTHYLMTSVEECAGQWNEQLAAASNSSLAVYCEPELLEFQLSPSISVSLNESLEHFKTTTKTIHVLHSTFGHYGKAILKEHRMHPEAFVQCAIHATYFRRHGRMAPAYVTASTRRFHNGRTETCRSCYTEMRDFAKFINDNRPPNDDGRRAQTYALLRRSVTRFQELMNEASNGHGCDRHLMGLYLTAILEGKKVPELFDDELVQRTNNYILSTSCSGYWNVCGGVPPLVEDGYGCFYGIEDNAITFGLTAYKTSKETNLELFHRNLFDVLLEMQQVLLNSKL
uniref:Peroxisomal carnitine O-octanoyltransferase n=1 Tax=Aceria tosichella TaxID=561515 RepID=A0A6G1SJK9_9ACAR